MKTEQIATFTPITVTAETLQMLARQPYYPDLLALYMAYVEITTWQNNRSIKATKSFMMERLKWGSTKYAERKATLLELGLIENVTRTDKKTHKITEHYVLVQYVVSTESHLHHGSTDGSTENDPNKKATCTVSQRVESSTPSTINLQTSTNNSKTITGKQGNELLAIVNEVTGRKLRTLPNGWKTTLKTFTLDEVKSALLTLSKDEWHSPRLKTLNIAYLLRPTTIDKFLGESSGDAERSIGWD